MGATPLTLRCPKCKRFREFDMSRPFYDNRSNLNLRFTGRTKVMKKYGRKRNVVLIEMEHNGPSAFTSPNKGAHCGYVFWTSHPSAVRFYTKEKP